MYVIKLLREALKLLRYEYEQQTKRFELGGGFRQVMTAPDSTFLDPKMKPSYREEMNDPYTMATDVSNIGFSLNQD